MALFKIFKGNQTENLINKNAANYRQPVDGYAYYDTSSKWLYIDADYDNNGVITREPINAYSAKVDSVGNIIKDTYAKRTHSVYYVLGSSAGSAGDWTGTIDNEVTELYDGLTIIFCPQKAGVSNSTNRTLTNDDSTTVSLRHTCLKILGVWKPVYYQQYNASNQTDNRLTTHYGANAMVLMIYRTAANNGSGGWVAGADYNSDAPNYRQSDLYFRPYASTNTIYRYKICALDKDNRLVPLTITNQTNSTNIDKTQTALAFKPDQFWFYNTTTATSAGTLAPAQVLYRMYGDWASPQYTFNTTIPAYTLTYLKGSLDTTTGLFTLDQTSHTSWQINVPTNTANLTLTNYFTTGSYYILMGGTYSSANYFCFFENNPMFYFDGTNLVQVSHTAIKATQDGAGNNIVNTYLTKTAGVTNVSWDGTNKKLTKTINGSTTDIVTASTLKTDLGLSSAMLFMGSLGTGGTITSLPTAASGNQGYTYKVITAGTYASKAAKVGDVFVSTGSTWELIPSGDEPSGTVTSITLKAGSGISLDTDDTAITISGTRTISHADTSSQASVTANGRKYITAVTLDDYGHVTGLSTGTETVTNTDTLVKQTAKSDNVNYKLLMGANSSPTSGTAYEAVYDTAITVNPSTDTITATNFAGNASTATKATQDESGNNIKATYAASFSISDHTITLKNKNGASLGTVTVPDNNTNYYPTTFTWTNGTTAGPTGSLTGSGMSAVSFAAIPSASTTTSGIITTDSQTVAGNKFTSGKHIGLISGGEADQFLDFAYAADPTASKAPGASWRVGALNSGSGDTNYFVIQTGGSDTNSTTWSNAMRIGMNTLDVAVNGNLYALSSTNTKTLGTSSNRWKSVYIGTADTYGSSTQPIYWNAGVPTAISYTIAKSVPSNAVFTDTDTKQNITLATTSKAYLTGVTTQPTSTATALTGVSDTGVYLTTTAGEFSAVRHSFNVGSTEKAYMIYNSTTDSIDFIFV